MHSARRSKSGAERADIEDADVGEGTTPTDSLSIKAPAGDDVMAGAISIRHG